MHASACSPLLACSCVFPPCMHAFMPMCCRSGSPPCVHANLSGSLSTHPPHPPHTGMHLIQGCGQQCSCPLSLRGGGSVEYRGSGGVRCPLPRELYPGAGQRVLESGSAGSRAAHGALATPSSGVEPRGGEGGAVGVSVGRVGRPPLRRGGAPRRWGESAWGAWVVGAACME